MTPSQSVLTSLEQFFNRIGQLPTFTYYVQSRHTHENAQSDCAFD